MSMRPNSGILYNVYGIMDQGTVVAMPYINNVGVSVDTANPRNLIWSTDAVRAGTEYLAVKDKTFTLEFYPEVSIGCNSGHDLSDYYQTMPAIVDMLQFNYDEAVLSLGDPYVKTVSDGVSTHDVICVDVTPIAESGDAELSFGCLVANMVEPYAEYCPECGEVALIYTTEEDGDDYKFHNYESAISISVVDESEIPSVTADGDEKEINVRYEYLDPDGRLEAVRVESLTTDKDKVSFILGYGEPIISGVDHIIPAKEGIDFGSRHYSYDLVTTDTQFDVSDPDNRDITIQYHRDQYNYAPSISVVSTYRNALTSGQIQDGGSKVFIVPGITIDDVGKVVSESNSANTIKVSGEAEYNDTKYGRMYSSRDLELIEGQELRYLISHVSMPIIPTTITYNVKYEFYSVKDGKETLEGSRTESFEGAGGTEINLNENYTAKMTYDGKEYTYVPGDYRLTLSNDTDGSTIVVKYSREIPADKKTGSVKITETYVYVKADGTVEDVATATKTVDNIEEGTIFGYDNHPGYTFATSHPSKPGVVFTAEQTDKTVEIIGDKTVNWSVTYKAVESNGGTTDPGTDPGNGGNSGTENPPKVGTGSIRVVSTYYTVDTNGNRIKLKEIASDVTGLATDSTYGITGTTKYTPVTTLSEYPGLTFTMVGNPADVTVVDNAVTSYNVEYTCDKSAFDAKMVKVTILHKCFTTNSFGMQAQYSTGEQVIEVWDGTTVGVGNDAQRKIDLWTKDITYLGDGSLHDHTLNSADPTLTVRAGQSNVYTINYNVTNQRYGSYKPTDSEKAQLYKDAVITGNTATSGDISTYVTYYVEHQYYHLQSDGTQISEGTERVEFQVPKGTKLSASLKDGYTKVDPVASHQFNGTTYTYEAYQTSDDMTVADNNTTIFVIKYVRKDAATTANLGQYIVYHDLYGYDSNGQKVLVQRIPTDIKFAEAGKKVGVQSTGNPVDIDIEKVTVEGYTYQSYSGIVTIEANKKSEIVLTYLATTNKADAATTNNTNGGVNGSSGTSPKTFDNINNNAPQIMLLLLSMMVVSTLTFRRKKVNRLCSG